MRIIYSEEVWSLAVEAGLSTNWRCGTKRPTEALSWVTLSAKASARVGSDERMLDVDWVVVNLAGSEISFGPGQLLTLF